MARSSWLPVAVVVLALGTTRALASRPAELAVEVAPGLSCPSTEQLLAALDDALPEWHLTSGVARVGSPRLQIEPASAGMLGLRLSSPGHPSERRQVAFVPTECVETARTVALIAKVWLRHHPPAPPEAIKPDLSMAPQLDVLQGPAVVPPPDLSEVDAGTSEAELTTPDAGVVELGLDLILVPASEKLPPPPVVEAPPHHLEARLGGQAWDGIDTDAFAAVGSVDLDFSWGETIGVNLGAGLATPLSSGSGPGSVTVERGTVALGGWLSTGTPGSESQVQLRADALLGILYDTAQAATTGAPPSTSGRVNGGVELTLLWEFRLVAGLRLWVGPSAQLWAGQESFSNPTNDPVDRVVTPLFWVGATAGLGWRFF